MKIFENEPVSRQGYWRVGGPMDRFAILETIEELIAVSSQITYVIGNGSNLLVPDAGLRGLTVRPLIRTFEVLDPPDSQSVRVKVGSGMLNMVLLNRLEKAGLSGLGCLAGVPGTIGGAVAMNAGTAMGELESVLESVEGIAAGQPTPITLSRAQLPMHYREGGLPQGFIVTSATLQLKTADAQETERIRHHLDRRKATQPLELPSCGSVFRNPPGDYAGRLIESCGLKGWQHGGAQISPKHGNFIVNLGDASALDVMMCIKKAWMSVQNEYGVQLIPEVRVLGDWDVSLWPLS